jgi:hypothetical protein
MITLRIFLMGLVTLMPQEVKGRRTITILLQEARHEHHPHIPVLIYEEAQRVCTPMPACQVGDGYEIATLLNRERRSPGILLKGVDIQVQNADEGGVQLLEGTYDKRFYHSWLGVVPRTAEACNDFGWISHLEDVVPGSHKVRSDVLTAPAGKLAGRLLLQGGKLSTFGLADLQGFVRSMTFKKLGSMGPLRGEKHALGDTAVVDLKVSGDKVEILLQPFSGSPQTLTLEPAEGSDVVEILLGNLTPLMDNVDKSKPAEHFALYTKLSDNPKTPQEMKIPHLGWGVIKIRRSAVETAATPEVIRSISAIGSTRAVAKAKAMPGMAGISGDEGGTNRPICTLGVMAPPD